MTEREALNLALDALKTLMIERGSIYDKATTAIKEALAQPEQKPVAHSVVAGALFDFMGWLTSRNKRLTLSGADEASPAVEAIQEFSEKRGLSLKDAEVGFWTEFLSTPPQRKPPKAGDGSALFYEAVRLLDNAIFAQSGDVIRHDSAAHREAVDFFNQVFTRLDSPPPPQRPSRSDIKPLTKIIPMAQPAVTESHKQESVETLDHKAIGKQAYESGYSTGYMDCAVKMQAKKEQEPVTDNTYGYAKSLAEAIFKQHFSSDEHYASGRIVWDVNDTVIGILTQIDNMVAGMVRKPEQEPINDGWQITFANGHSGFGVYAHMDEHPEEGSILLCAVPQWAKDALKTTTPLPCQTCEALARTVMMDQTGRDA